MYLEDFEIGTAHFGGCSINLQVVMQDGWIESMRRMDRKCQKWRLEYRAVVGGCLCFSRLSTFDQMPPGFALCHVFREVLLASQRVDDGNNRLWISPRPIGPFAHPAFLYILLRDMITLSHIGLGGNIHRPTHSFMIRLHVCSRPLIYHNLFARCTVSRYPLF